MMTKRDMLLGGPGLDGYAFQADVYCVPCGQQLAQYERLAEAYRLAAAAVGLAAHEVQAITWVAWRDSWDRNAALAF